MSELLCIIAFGLYTISVMIRYVNYLEFDYAEGRFEEVFAKIRYGNRRRIFSLLYWYVATVLASIVYCLFEFGPGRVLLADLAFLLSKSRVAWSAASEGKIDSTKGKHPFRFVRWILRRVCSEKIFARIFAPTLDDGLAEHHFCLASHRKWRARQIVALYHCKLVATIAFQFYSSTVGKVVREMFSIKVED